MEVHAALSTVTAGQSNKCKWESELRRRKETENSLMFVKKEGREKEGREESFLEAK